MAELSMYDESRRVTAAVEAAAALLRQSADTILWEAQEAATRAALRLNNPHFN